MDELDLDAITKRIVGGVLALISRNFLLNFISIAAFIIISKKLTATDLGIYTVAINAQNLISFFTDFGLGAALIQKKDSLEEKDITTVFTLQFIITLVIFILAFVFLSQLAQLFRLNSAGAYLFLVLILSIFLSSFKLIPSILLERSIQFQKLVIPHIAETFTFNLVLIILVLNNYGIVSYTWGFLLSSLIGIPVYYLVSPWKIRMKIDKSALYHLKFGSQFQAKNILAALKDNLVQVVLPRFLPMQQIGYLGFGQRLAFIPYRYVVDSVTKVMFAAYARMQEDKRVLAVAIEKSLFFTSFIMFPTMMTLIILSPSLIHYFWHDKWDLSYISIVFFSLNALISSLSSILINVLDANGQVRTTLQLMLLWTVMTWILTPVLIYFYGYNGVAIASFTITLTILITIYLVRKVVKFNFIKSILKPTIGTVIISIFFLFSGRVFIHSLMDIVYIIILGIVLYLGILYAIARKQLHTDVAAILQRNG